MLEYDPSKLMYMGDEMSRSVTQAHKKRKTTGGARQQRNRDEEGYYNDGGMTLTLLKQWKCHDFLMMEI